MDPLSLIDSKELDTPARRLIEQEIRRHGPMTFHDFVDLALYHPLYGYYNQRFQHRGRGGDYFTSLQVSSLFPQIISDGLIEMRETLGTEQFTIVEIGSGGGEMLGGILEAFRAAGRARGWRVWAVERSRPARDQLWKTLSRFPKCEVVASFDDIDWSGGFEGCVLSNELFDALPFHRLRRSADGWKEIFIDLNAGALVEAEGSIRAPGLLEQCGLDHWETEIGQEVEARPAVDGLMSELGALLTRGYVLTLDYGYPRESLYSPGRPRGTWQCFYKHATNERAFERIGRQDITAHVDFTQLARAGERAGLETSLFCTQGIFLSNVGQKRIDAALRASPPEENRPLIAAVQQLVHPNAMGESFSALLQSKGVEMPASFQSISNRRRRLAGTGRS